MKKSIILMALVLLIWVVLPLQTSIASDAATQFDIGALMRHGQKAQTGMVASFEGSFITDTLKYYRVSGVVTILHTWETDEYQGVGFMFQAQKYLPMGSWFTPYVLFGAGGVSKIEKGEDKIALDLKLEFGIHVYDFIAVGATGYWMPQDGPDAVFVGACIKLLKPLL